MICSMPPQLTWRTVSAEGCVSPGERWPLSAHAATRPNGAHEYPSGPVTKHPKLGDLNSRHLFPHGSRGPKSETKVSAGLLPLGVSVAGSVPGLSPSFWGLLVTLVFHGLWTSLYPSIQTSFIMSSDGILPASSVCLSFLRCHQSRGVSVPP